MRILQIEFIKLRKPSTFIIFGLLLLLIAAVSAGIFNTSPHTEAEALFERVDSLQMGLIFIMFSVFVILNTASEYSENTLRRSIIEGCTRDEFFQGKLLLLIVAAIFLLVVQKTVLLLTAVNADFRQEAVDYLSKPAVELTALVKIIYYGIFALFLAFLTRSVAMGIVLYFAWIIIEFITNFILAFKHPETEWAFYLPGRSPAAVFSEHEFVALSLVLVPVAFQLVMMLIAYLLLLKRDIK